MSVDAESGRANRRSRILGDLQGGRSIAVAVASTVVFFAVIAVVVVNSAGWPEVRKAFFDRQLFTDSFP